MKEESKSKEKKNKFVAIWEKIAGKKETPEELARKIKEGKSGGDMDWLAPGH